MAVKLREKKLANGRVSFYLDIYHNRNRWYEFLKIYVNKEKPAVEDQEKRRLVKEICARREYQLLIEEYGLVDKEKREDDFVQFFSDFMDSKRVNHHRRTTINWLRKFTKGRRFSITQVTAMWLKSFEQYLLRSVSVNTALTYLRNINVALNELVRQQIIPRNPWHSIPRSERLRNKETMPTAWTIEQLQALASASCNIEPQFKQAYFFACFTGLRWGDVRSLTWSSIIQRTNEEWYIYFRQGKTGGVGYFPLSNQAIEILKVRLMDNQNLDDVLIFPKLKEVVAGKYITHRRVLYALKKWTKIAGLDDKKMHFHTGRHSFATNILQSTNGDLYTVSKLLGHADMKTTQRYAQVRDSMKQAAVESFSKIKFDFSKVLR